MKTLKRILCTNPLSGQPPKWALERIDAMVKERDS